MEKSSTPAGGLSHRRRSKIPEPIMPLHQSGDVRRLNIPSVSDLSSSPIIVIGSKITRVQRH